MLLLFVVCGGLVVFVVGRLMWLLLVVVCVVGDVCGVVDRCSLLDVVVDVAVACRCWCCCWCCLLLFVVGVVVVVDVVVVYFDVVVRYLL